MKSSDIRTALAADPDTVFALRPDARTTRVVMVRGLEPAPRGLGCWTYSAFTNPQTGEWHPHPGRSVFLPSRDIIPLADALAELAARNDESARHRAIIQACERCVALLDQHGVQARVSGGRVVVEDALSLEMALDRFAGSVVS
jgi:hypothetical protein